MKQSNKMVIVRVDERFRTDDGREWVYNGSTIEAVGEDRGIPSVASVTHWASAEMRPGTSLAFVPDIIRHFSPQNQRAARDSLLVAHGIGNLELRPEGGLNRVSAADLALCPKGALGVPLTWARVLRQS